MKEVRIQLYEKFRFFINDYEISLGVKSAEFLALMAAVGGNKVNAKDTWTHLKKPCGISYNSAIYTAYFEELQDDLTQHGVENLLMIGYHPVRACRIDRTLVRCDYYDILDGNSPPKPKDLFLPEYVWARDFCFSSWEALNTYWNTLHANAPGV